VDDAVAIRSLKRFMIEQEKEVQLPEIRVSAENAARKIAIVGSGPAGLSCGYFLARLGYWPTIFEALNKPGGLLNQVIPEYRLPRDVLQKDIQVIEHLGVTIETGKRLGKDFTLESLKDDGYQAVFLGVGAPYGAPLRIPGEEAKGVLQAIDFLRDYNMQKIKKVGDHVIVIGGGNAAVDAARTALRLGAKSVSIAYRRTRVEMPAYVEEIEDAEREGIQIDFLLSPVEIVTQGNKMVGVKFCRMKLGEFDSSGRRRPVNETIEGSEFVMEADQCLLAIGQALKPETILGNTEMDIDKWGYIKADPVTGQTSQSWIFAGGDAVSGPSSVVEAVAQGELAAVGMDQYLTGEYHAFWRQPKVIDTFFDPDADPVDYPRSRSRTIPVAQRARNFMEVELPWSKPVALREASRCLRCDYRDEDAA
jgi:NADH-quinone oxidoreductase subunit F